MEILYAKEAYKIQGAAFEVYKEIGCGFLEAVYQECLENEFLLQGIPFSSQLGLLINFGSNNGPSHNGPAILKSSFFT